MLPKKILDLIEKVDKLLDMVVNVLNRVNEMIDLLKATQPTAQGASAPPSGETAEQLVQRLEYESYTVQEVLDRLGSLSPTERKLLLQYERKNKDRIGITRALEEMNAAAR